MSDELRLLLQMKRTSKLILLLVGFVAASFILQLAIVVKNFRLYDVHTFVERQRIVPTDTLWSVFKPAKIITARDSKRIQSVKSIK